ncbi:MAG: chemotaxis response regulator protein-glutamate methylesterase [Opitutaceae bacterium]|nr:chemotaxis response regulator protein-glutamate methylesterase [Opitutaceae bacterium]
MPKIRVLIVDDSVVVRRLVSDCLAGDPEIEVVGTAADGQIALAKIPQVNPDLVTLDIEMPVLDGLQTVSAIRKTYAKLPVIMFSTLTERGGAATLDALARGANDYVTKPANVGSVAQSIERVREDLIPKIKSLCRRAAPVVLACPIIRPPKPPVAGSGSPLGSAASFVSSRVDVLAIGVSTGGPNALAAMMPGLAKRFPVPIVIVQHMPPLFTRMLAERIEAVTGMPTREGVAGAILKPGEIWVAPGGHHMDLEKTPEGVRLRVHDAPPENSCRPAVDVLFRAVAKIYGPRALSVILTGMGQDGLVGCQHIREAGGQVLVQDEATSVVWGMPGAVATAGLAQKILPLGEIAAEINLRVAPRFPTVAPLSTVLPKAS